MQYPFLSNFADGKAGLETTFSFLDVVLLLDEASAGDLERLEEGREREPDRLEDGTVAIVFLHIFGCF
jgi:hypothetical protein